MVIQDQDFSLKQLLDFFKDKLHLTPQVGIEVEFYIHGICDVRALGEKVGYKIEKEKGSNQYEIKLEPSYDIIHYCKSVHKIRDTIGKEARNLGVEVDFTPKPFADDYGSSMHVNLSFREDKEMEKYAQILCHFAPGMIKCFLPGVDDYKRLDSRFMAPTCICYGGNNRTVMIRIPDATPKRLEHRLASADADPALVIYSMLDAIKKGLANPGVLKNFKKIFGNAYDEQYGLKKITIESKNL